MADDLCWCGKPASHTTSRPAMRGTGSMTPVITRLIDHTGGHIAAGRIDVEVGRVVHGDAVGLVGDRPVLVLDEPTTGLDPTARRAVWSPSH